MAARLKNLIVFAGAPDCDTLDWEDSDLNSTLLSPVRRFLGEPVATVAASPTQATHPQPKWRAVTIPSMGVLANNVIGKALDEENDEDAQIHPLEPNTLEHTSFLEHSLNVLEDLQASQIEATKDAEFESTVFLTSGSFNHSDTDDLSLRTSVNSAFKTAISSGSTNSDQRTVTFTGPVTDLKALPSARDLQSLHPQTQTVNLVVGVISVQPLRTVALRRRNAEMEIVELLVGDETRAGFGISFWLTPRKGEHASHDPAERGGTVNCSPAASLRAELLALHTGHVLLIRNVALHVFRGVVYGQSLSRRFHRNRTCVDVLTDGIAAPEALVQKLERVTEWKARFVRGGRKRSRSQSATGRGVKKARRREEELPPDTQDD